MLEGRHIVITSNEPWSDTWYSKQNYAWELARKNTVYFIDPPQGFSAKGIFGSGVTARQLHERLFVLQYANARPVRSAALYAQNDRIVSKRLRRYFEEQGIRDFLFWSFDPYRLSDPQVLGAQQSIFHAVDQYNFVPFGEKELAQKSGLVICVAESFCKAYEPLNKNVRYLPHLISEEEFSAGDAIIRESLPKGKFGLYIGNIDDRVDYTTVEHLLKRFPDTPFVFVGKTCYSDANEKARFVFESNTFPNLFTTGVQPFKSLKHYIAASAFCIAPMNRNHPGNTISHHKILQYLALGKPVFSCRFSAYDALSEILSMHDDDVHLLNAVDQFRQSGEPAAAAETRIAFARQFTFAPAFEKIEHWLNTATAR